MRKLPAYPSCFVCGHGNPIGLDVRFSQNGEFIEATFVPGVFQTGYPNAMHEGLLTALLMEAMGWAASLHSSTLCIIAELTVRFLRPVPLGSQTHVRARFERERVGMCFTLGELLDDTGQVCVRAEGVYTPLPEVQARELLSQFIAAEEDTADLNDLFPNLFWGR